jgi:hypothetical protein
VCRTLRLASRLSFAKWSSSRSLLCPLSPNAPLVPVSQRGLSAAPLPSAIKPWRCQGTSYAVLCVCVGGHTSTGTGTCFCLRFLCARAQALRCTIILILSRRAGCQLCLLRQLLLGLLQLPGPIHQLLPYRMLALLEALQEVRQAAVLLYQPRRLFIRLSTPIQRFVTHKNSPYGASFSGGSLDMGAGVAVDPAPLCALLPPVVDALSHLPSRPPALPRGSRHPGRHCSACG